MTIPERINAIIDYYGLNPQRFAQRIGVKSKQAVYNLLYGQTRSLSESMISKITSAFPDVSRYWLITGDGEMLLSTNDDNDSVEEVQADVVPLLPMSAYAGSFSELIEQGATEADCEKIVSPVKGCDFAISISGDSMEPDYPSGCRVFIRRINPDLFIPWGNVFVLDTDNGAYIKKVFPGADTSTIVAKSINPKYPDFIIPIECVRGIYMVIMMAIAYAAR